MKKPIIIAAIIIVIAAAGWYFMKPEEEKKEDTYKYAVVTRGTLENIISSSGTLEALSTLDVGTQVSGTISKIFVDFNDNVKKGQLLALVDTTFLAASVKDASANLLRAQAQYDQADAKYKRDKSLFEKKFISELDYVTSKADLQAARASLQSARYALEKAETNLSYAVIRSPINGKIINRNIETGQTVAASFSTPTLFTIAADLSRMRILASVDESDIGQIKQGQEVSFNVQAYPDKKFYGTVDQIRLNPKTEQNVVNYTVVINAANNEQLLLPGMTATVDFYIEQKNDVLLLPNSALRFKPTVEMMEEFQNNMREEMENTPDSVKKKFDPSKGGNVRPAAFSGAQGAPNGNAAGNGNGQEKQVMLWYQDNQGKIKMAPAVTGSTDGKMTEIVHAARIGEGTKVIISAKGTQMGNNFPRMNFGFGSRQQQK